MLEIIRENFKFIRQIIKLAKSDLIKQYKGAALGPMWALVKPAITIFVYWFAFQIGLRGGKSVEGYSFFIFLLVGITPWFFMSEAILDGSRSLRKYSQFVTKMPFPMSTIMTFNILSKLFSHLGLLVIMYIIALCSGVQPSIYNIQLLWYTPLMFLFFTCLSWITAPLSAISKDFENIIRSIITAIFWLSGIIWNPYTLPNPVLKRIVLASPVNYFANGYRNSILYKTWFFECRYETVCFLVMFAVVVILGSYTYKKTRKVIPDIL